MRVGDIISISFWCVQYFCFDFSDSIPLNAFVSHFVLTPNLNADLRQKDEETLSWFDLANGLMVWRLGDLNRIELKKKKNTDQLTCLLHSVADLLGTAKKVTCGKSMLQIY